MIMFFFLHWWWVHWRSSYYQHFNSCYLKDSLQSRALVSSGILLEMRKQAPVCLNQNLHFNKLPVIVCILKFKDHHSKIYIYLISILLYKKKTVNKSLFTVFIHGTGEGNGHTLQYSCLENSNGQSLVGYSSWGHRVRH